MHTLTQDSQTPNHLVHVMTHNTLKNILKSDIRILYITLVRGTPSGIAPNDHANLTTILSL